MHCIKTKATRFILKNALVRSDARISKSGKHARGCLRKKSEAAQKKKFLKYICKKQTDKNSFYAFPHPFYGTIALHYYIPYKEGC